MVSLKRKLGKQIFNNSLIYSLYIFLLEIVVKINTDNNLLDWSSLRIFISSLILGTIIGLLLSFIKGKVSKIVGTIITFLLCVYTWIEINLYNYLGFFMGAGNAEQGTKIVDYISDYIAAAKLISLLVLIPFIFYLIYVWFLDSYLKRKKLERTRVFIFKRDSITRKSLSLITTIFIIVSLSILYYISLDASFMQNKLQSIKNTTLIKTSDNSNLSVSQFGLFTYALSDLTITTFDIEDDSVELIATDIPKKEEAVVNDYTRIIDDTAWNMLIENETNSTYNKLNNYFINRSVTPKNDYTGIFEGKNLIVVLMESVNMIAINEEEFPTLYKMYNEGISFRNNYSPRNNCSTGNNEMTGITSLYTINQECTANTYNSPVIELKT